MKNISYYMNWNGFEIPVKMFLQLAGNLANYHITKVAFKHDLRYWNDSPWSEQPAGAYRVQVREGRNYVDGGVYQIWSRRDGMGGRVEFFETFAEFESYSPSGESPNAIKQELGLCENYAKGQ